MTSTTTGTTEIDPEPRAASAYLAAVAAALAGVADPVRQELLDDLADHLAELEAEDGESLGARLGAPEAYAADLVASAGIVVGERPGAAPAPVWRRAFDGLTTAARGHRAERARAFAVEVRPGWWLARGWCVLALLTVVTSDNRATFPLPDVFANDALSMLALVGAMVLSVRLGRLGGWPDRLLTAVALVGLLLAIGDGGSHRDDGYQYGYQPPGYLQAPDGSTITNIWPYDGEGKPIPGVLLFDQDGRPISVGELYSEPGQMPIPGLFPQPQVTYEYDPGTGEGRQVSAPAPEISVPRLPGTSATTVPTDQAVVTTAPPPSG